MRHSVLVVGGAGETGSLLCKRLCKEHVQVVCVDDLSSGSVEHIEDLFNRRNFEFVNLDISTYQPWKSIDSQLGHRCRFKEIYYLASNHANAIEMHDAHISGLRNVLEMTQYHRGSLLIVSPPHSKKKLSPSQSNGAYYYTKKAGESLARSYQSKFRINLTVVECDDGVSHDISKDLVRSMRGRKK